MRSPIFPYLVALTASAVGCGASINAVYEGDVRFEHCMALDSRTDLKPTLRRACWQEWLQFYTFGQTRDRVEYATLREKQLGKTSDFDEGEWNPPSSRLAAAVPEPTSALAPPPMLLSTDAGAPPEQDAGTTAPREPAAAEEVRPPAADCAGSCTASWSSCRKDCKSPACEKGCSSKYKRCMRRCY